MATFEELAAKSKALRDKIGKLTAEIREISAKDNLTAGDEQRAKRLQVGADKAMAQLEVVQAEQREDLLDGARTGRYRADRGATEIESDPLGEPESIPRSGGPWASSSVFDGTSASDMRSRALSAAERAPGSSDQLRGRLVEILEQAQDEDGRFAEQITASTDPDYLRAFRNLIAGETILTAPEAAAVRRVRRSQRAMGLTDNAGGYLIPAQLDPTLLITGAGSQSDIAEISRTEIATGDTWTGVSAAQITASFDAEAAEVSDDSPTLAGPSIPIHMSRVFVPYSIEVGLDGANFTQSIVGLMADAQRNLEASVLATGTGSGEPTGIITALTGTGSIVTSAATDTFALADVYATYEALAARYVDRASWVANEIVWDLVRQMGTAGAPASFMTDPMGTNLLGHRRYSSSSFDSTITGSSENYLMVFGDWSNYVIARRIGFTVEPIQHLFATTNGRPTGQRGLFGFARLGADSVNDGGFAMLNVT